MRYFDPTTGECYDFEAGQTPPRGWKKVKPIPSPIPPGLGPGGTITWQPGKEPKLIINAKTGESRWLQFPHILPDGWQHLKMRHTPPGNTGEAGSYYNPQTGESYNFEPDQKPPAGWKKLGPIPSPIPPGLGPGGTVTWVPGREPRLYINRETGECRWVYFGEIPMDGWVPFNPLRSSPQKPEEEKTYFNPQTGDSYKVSEGWTPPPGWKILRQIPSPFPPGLPPGSTVTYPPGKEPRLFVNTETGESRWVQFGEFPIEPWKPLSQKPFPAGTSEEQSEQEIKNSLLEEWVRLYGSEATTDYPLEPEKDEAASRAGRSRGGAGKDDGDDEWWITSFAKALPGAVAETFTSGEAYSSFAQASQTAVGFITLGLVAGDPEGRAKELEAMGFKRPDRETEAIARGIGTYAIGLPLSLALTTGIWTKVLRGPSMSVAVRVPGPSTQFMTHVVYGVRGWTSNIKWMHAMGDWFAMSITKWRSFQLIPGWIALTEIPIINPVAVLAMAHRGHSAWFCFTAAVTGFFRGWRPF